MDSAGRNASTIKRIARIMFIDAVPFVTRSTDQVCSLLFLSLKNQKAVQPTTVLRKRLLLNHHLCAIHRESPLLLQNHFAGFFENDRNRSVPQFFGVEEIEAFLTRIAMILAVILLNEAVCLRPAVPRNAPDRDDLTFWV